MVLEMKKDVIYRCIGSDFTNGIIACGYMTKPLKEHSQYNFLIDYYSCFLLLSGNGSYYGEEGKRYPLEPGTVVQRLPGLVHSTEVTPDGSWLEFFISFGRSTYDYLCSLKLLPIASPVIRTDFDDSLLSSFSRLLDQMKKADDTELPFLSLKAQKLVLTLLQPQIKSSNADSMKEAMEEACRYLSPEIGSSLSLEDIAARLGMSYENFRKQFRKYTGSSPAQYRTMQRMKHAKLMLLSGISIKETAALTGYSDTYSFTKQFTHTVGMPPGRYRKESLG
ncbi:MAG TPA: helix-turn-helix transcriptional regulator [Clostridiales bacterium]|nr:helix-turn-helix transcriptional regulator [Clostridiales bacterium]